MKRIWLVLLSLGLFMAFSVSAYAVDIKVGAEYYAAGMYLNKVTVDNGFEDWQGETGSIQPSTAFFFQRLRVGTDFIVSPSLKLVTRFDAMERIWGGARSNTWQVNQDGYLSESAGTQAENENIAFDIIYIDYLSPIGLFKVGYMPDYLFGTVFADNGTALYDGQIQYFIQKGPFIGFVGYSKVEDNSWSSVTSNSWNFRNYINGTRTDRDHDSYRIAGIYNFKSGNVAGEAGALLLWDRNADHRGWASTSTDPLYVPVPYLQNVYLLDPFVKAKIGPVSLQAELLYYWGNAAKFEYDISLPGVGNTIGISALSAFVDANANFGMFNVGGTVAYLSGDNPDTNDKIEGGVGVNNGGFDFNPCLIMFNTETLGYWVGPIVGHSGSVLDEPMSNAWFFQGRVGVKPTPQWDINASLSYAYADRKPDGFANGTYGTEIDLTGTYKITNNLSYMLGVGYLFTGDYFKGYDYDFGAGGSKVNDDYILINKLTLSF